MTRWKLFWYVLLNVTIIQSVWLNVWMTICLLLADVHVLICVQVKQNIK